MTAPGSADAAARNLPTNGPRPERRGLWQSYLRSLKPLEVEEPIDVWLHRPLAYLLARAALPTPISPNLITSCSIVFGLAAGTSMVVSYPHHLQWAGLLIFLSAVFDCADGQLARLRGTSSAFGRMLDGIADLVVSIAAVGGGIWVVSHAVSEPWWLQLALFVMAVTTAVTGSFHTSMYDHYKNVFLRLTSPSYKEGEDYETARERYNARSEQASLWTRLCWPVYLFYVRSQMDYVRGFDPHTTLRLSHLPAYDPAHAAVYRAHAGKLMAIWRSFFGFGSLVFGMAVGTACNVLEWYMLFRLLLLNGLFYGYMRPAQRRASKAAFAELELLAKPA
jgi:hypothetical protein